MEITAVADEQTCTWLRMSGIGDVFPVKMPEEADKAEKNLKDLMKNLDIAIILISPEVAQANARLVQLALSKKDVFPIVLELPLGSSEEEQKSNQLQDLISIALGIEFKV